eukprot:3381584-Rhodomonas_salina.6
MPGRAQGGVIRGCEALASERESLSENLHPEIKDKTTHSWYKLYRDCQAAAIPEVQGKLDFESDSEGCDHECHAVLRKSQVRPLEAKGRDHWKRRVAQKPGPTAGSEGSRPLEAKGRAKARSDRWKRRVVTERAASETRTKSFRFAHTRNGGEGSTLRDQRHATTFSVQFVPRVWLRVFDFAVYVDVRRLKDVPFKEGGVTPEGE